MKYILLILLTGCISVHPPELPRVEGHSHGGTALHSECKGCGQQLTSFVRNQLLQVLAPITTNTRGTR